MIKIVKSFEDPEFFAHPLISTSEYRGRYKWFWGLGSDGNIYYRCTRFTDPDEWRAIEDYGEIASLISLKIMKKLVKQFEHLVIFT